MEKSVWKREDVLDLLSDPATRVFVTGEGTQTIYKIQKYSEAPLCSGRGSKLICSMPSHLARALIKEGALIPVVTVGEKGYVYKLADNRP